MIYVVADILIKKNKIKQFVDILKTNIPNVLEEEGCVEYTLTEPIQLETVSQNKNIDSVSIIEKWETIENLKVHLSAPHMQAYRDAVKDIVEKTILKVTKSIEK